MGFWGLWVGLWGCLTAYRRGGGAVRRSGRADRWSGRTGCPRRRTTRTRSPSRSTASAGASRGSTAARWPVPPASCRGFQTPGAWLIHRCSSMRRAAGEDGTAGSARSSAFSARGTPSSWPPRSSRATPARPGCRCPTPRTSSPPARSTPLSCPRSRLPGRRRPPPAVPRRSRLPLPLPHPPTRGSVGVGCRGRAAGRGAPYRRRGVVTGRAGPGGPRGRVPRGEVVGPAVRPGCARARVSTARLRPGVRPRLPVRAWTTVLALLPVPAGRPARPWPRPLGRRTAALVTVAVTAVLRVVAPGRTRAARRGTGCGPCPTGRARGMRLLRAYDHELPFRRARVG